MKVSKFKEIETYENILHQAKVEESLESIKTQDQELHGLASSHTQNLHDASAAQSTNQHAEVTGDIDEVKAILSGVKPRSDRTKIFNQKIDENFIILETTDELMRLPDQCEDIFNPATALKEVNQFFILEEDIDSAHCPDRKFNFDTDTKYAMRLDSYSGDAAGFYDVYGHLENNSSDIFLINDTLYKIELQLDGIDESVQLEDGFNLAFNDLEQDNILSFKRNHTISGYTFKYIVESKANS
jgi:hypothetical protein